MFYLPTTVTVTNVKDVKVGNETVNTKTLVTGASDNLIAITASRTFGLDVMEGKLTLRAKPVLPLHFGFLSNQYGTKSGNNDWVYSNNKNEIDIVLVPELNLGAQYQLLPKKVDFNCGANFALGTLGWNILTTNHRYDETTKNCAGWVSTTNPFWGSIGEAKMRESNNGVYGIV